MQLDAYTTRPGDGGGGGGTEFGWPTRGRVVGSVRGRVRAGNKFVLKSAFVPVARAEKNERLNLGVKKRKKREKKIGKSRERAYGNFLQRRNY